MFFDLNIPHGDMRLESILNRMIECMLIMCAIHHIINHIVEYFGVGLNQTIDAKALPKSVSHH